MHIIRIVDNHLKSLLWRHDGHDSVSNHQSHKCLLNRPSRRRSKKTSKLHVTVLCAGIHRRPVNSPHNWPVTRKCFHLMTSSCTYNTAMAQSSKYYYITMTLHCYNFTLKCENKSRNISLKSIYSNHKLHLLLAWSASLRHTSWTIDGNYSLIYKNIGCYGLWIFSNKIFEVTPCFLTINSYVSGRVISV